MLWIFLTLTATILYGSEAYNLLLDATINGNSGLNSGLQNNFSILEEVGMLMMSMTGVYVLVIIIWALTILPFFGSEGNIIFLYGLLIAVTISVCSQVFFFGPVPVFISLILSVILTVITYSAYKDVEKEADNRKPSVIMPGRR